MKKLYSVQLSSAQRLQLEQLISTGSHKARVLARARTLLLANQNRADLEIAAALNLSAPTIQRIRKRFAELGLDGAIYDSRRPGRPPVLTGDIEAKLVMLACSQAPKGHARWTLNLLADKMVELHYAPAISDEQVRTMLKKTNLNLGGSKHGVLPKPTPAL